MFWNKKKKLQEEAALTAFRENIGSDIVDNCSCISKPKIYKDACNLVWVYIDYIYNGRWSNYACYLNATTLEHVGNAWDRTGW